MTWMRNRRRAVASATAALAALALLAGCSSGGGGTTPAPEPTVEAVDLLSLDELYAGTEGAPPASGPAAVTGANVWWISCGESIPACSGPAAAAAEAAEVLGWDFHIADGALNVGGGNATAIRTALAANPDALVLHGISCEAVRQPLLEAKDQGVPVLALEGLDCADQPLFSAPMKYGEEFTTVEEYFQSWGYWDGSYIAAAYPEATIIEERGSEPLFVEVAKGFDAVMKNCAHCTIVDTISFTSPDQVPNGPLSQRLRASLAANPTVNVVMMPVDSGIQTGGGAQDVAESGIDGLTIVGGTGGNPQMWEYLRDGIATMITAHDVDWFSWAAVDNVNRVLAGEETVPQGLGIRAITLEANLPAVGEQYHSPVEWRAAYESVWKG